MNLGEKLLELRKEVPYLEKATKGYQYTYVSGADVLGALKDKLNELGVLLIPKIICPSIEPVEIKGKMNFVFSSEMEMTWMDVEDGEVMIVPFFCTGMQDDPSKAYGSALTYSERYFLLKFFSIATDSDDPDKFQKKHEKKVQYMNQAQKKKLGELIKTVGLDRESCSDVLAKFGYASSAEITEDKFDVVYSAFEEIVDESK